MDYCFLLQNDAIVKIQAWMRANVAQNDYRKLSMYWLLDSLRANLDSTILLTTLVCHFCSVCCLRQAKIILNNLSL